MLFHLGYYCDDYGLTKVKGPCNEGSYCTLGAKFPEPRDNITGGICPRGYFCPRNTSVPLSCPRGTYSNSLRLVKVDECLDCDAGMYCDDVHLTKPAGNCSAGYYCPPGQIQRESEEYRYVLVLNTTTSLLRPSTETKN